MIEIKMKIGFDKKEVKNVYQAGTNDLKWVGWEKSF